MIRIVFAIALPQSLRRFINGALVGHGIPKASFQVAFEKAAFLLSDRLDNGLGDEQFRVLGAGSVQGAVAANQAAVPLVAGMVVGHAAAAAQNILSVEILVQKYCITK